jgi:hypothetical protein
MVAAVPSRNAGTMPGSGRSRAPLRLVYALLPRASIAAVLINSEVPAQTLRVAQPISVALGTAENPFYEPHLAINPRNPAHLLAVAIVHGGASAAFEDRMKAQRCAAFVSFDAGMTWARHDFETTRCFDPWAALTPDGRALVTSLGAHPSMPQQGQVGLVAYRSADGGRTWGEAPSGLGRNYDHTTMVADTNPGRRQGWIYLSSNRTTSVGDGVRREAVQIQRSRDGGATFDDPVFVIPNNLKMFAEMPIVLSDGTLIESFVDASQSVDTGGVARAQLLFDRRRAWIVRSSDGGHSFSTPMFVTDACGPPPGYRLSAFAADVSSGRFANRLYFVCRERSRGPIMLTYSRDGGETWTAARAVHTTAADSGVARVPGIAVNNRGIVLVAWIDAAGGRGRTCEQHLSVAASDDGGASFSRSQLVSSSAACSTGGDYFGLIALHDGRFRLLWSEMGDRGLRTTTIEVAPR